ncbi:MAG: YhgE/Pip domain-containing protein [Roseburia sp.]
MKNIVKIFVSDFKRLSRNVVAVVIIMGLTIIPCLYAWFNIFSNWDPYGESATSNMKIAVVSEDEGYTIEGLTLNVGDSVIEALEANSTIGWVFVDTAQDATDGVYAGDYYAALVVPKDFTSTLLSFLDGELEHPEIIYYENEKKNAIAPKITSKAQKTVREEVNATFVGTIAEVLMKVSGSISGIELDGNSLTDAVLTNLTELSGDLQTYVNILNSFVSITASANSLIETTQTVLPNLDGVIENGESTVNTMQSALIAASGSSDSIADMVTYSFDLLGGSLDDISSLIDAGVSNVGDWQGSAAGSLKGAQAIMPYLDQIFEGAVSEWNDESTAAQVDEIRTQLDTISTDLDQLAAVSEEGADNLTELREKVKSEIGVCKQQIVALRNTFEYSVRPQLNATVRSVQNSLVSAEAILYGVDADFADVSEALDGYAETLNQGNASIADSAAMAQELLNGLVTVIAEIEELEENEQYQKILEMVKSDPELIGQFMSSPVNLDTVEVYPIENYGSAMAPFYTILALWVGALILVALIHVKVEPEEGITNVKQYQRYFGRYLTFFFIGQAQTLITVLGDLYYVKIQCHEPFLFWLAAAVSSFAFTLFIYSLTVAFGNVGEAIAVIVMVIQVAGAGCTFPIEVLPGVFQSIYKYLPFQFGMNAMKETIGGLYGADYWKYISLYGAVIVVSLIIGLGLEIPFRKLNHMIEESKQKSDVMI